MWKALDRKRKCAYPHYLYKEIFSPTIELT